MLAFMPIQSYLMMYFAGAGWQIGKRKVSAIPNDKFNPMSSTDLLKTFTADLRDSIPELERSLNDITPLIETLMKQYGEFIKEAIRVAPAIAQSVGGALVNPKGALVPPAFGPELEKLITGSPTDAQFLAYAKILMQQELDKINAEKLQIQVDTAKTTFRPFQGPEINPATGEQSSFLDALQEARGLTPAAHIRDRSKSNVSLQSLRLEKSNLEFQIRRAATAHKNALALSKLSQGWPRSQQHRKIQAQQATGRTATALKRAQQNFANFMRMHGARF